MKRGHPFAAILGMDALARTGYQAGKSPVLPLFAAAIGASPELVGVAVAASTCTGVVLKPLIGRLSDRVGRAPLLWAGTAVFALVPLLYFFVTAPEELIGVRVLHGLATATYGPVMAAMVVDLSRAEGVGRRGTARRFGWYDFARSSGYVLGPALGGFLLAALHDPRWVYAFVGGMGLAAALPALLGRLRDPDPVEEPSPRRGTPFSAAAEVIEREPLVRAALAADFGVHLLSRFVRTFWPLAAAAGGLSVAWIGLAVSVQSGAALAARPLAGPIAQRLGTRSALAAALFLAAPAGLLLFVLPGPVLALLFAALLGVAEGVTSPLDLALVGLGARRGARGEVLGLLGSLRNGAKALGPIAGGLAVAALGGPAAAGLLGAGLLAAAAGVLGSRPRTLDGAVEEAR